MIPGNANPLLLASAAEAAAGAVATKSLRFNDGDSAYLSRTPSSAGNRKTWTFSTWCKQTTPEQAGILLNAQNGTSQGFANNFWILFYAGTVIVGDGSVDYLNTNKRRDASAWYHIVVACDTTQSSASDRLKIYINGVESTYTGDARSSISQNSNTTINSTYLHRIGSSGSFPAYFDGYLTDTYLIDGSALDPTSFGAFDDNGVWQAAAYSGTFGTNGFHLAFDDASSNAALGTDSSGNGNTFTVNNLIAAQFSPTATVVGDPTSSTDNPFGSGNGHSVDFDGNDSIRFSGPGLITGDLTVECFLKIGSSPSGYQRAFSTNEAVYSSEQTMIRRKNTGAFQFYFGDGTAEESDDTVDVGTWHHAAISYDQSASAVSYYVDGTRVGTDTYSGTVSITEMVVAGGMTNENFNGKVSNCRITKQLLYTGTSLTVPTSTLTTTSQGATASNVVMLCCHQSSTTAVEGAFSAASDTDCLFDVPTNGDQSDTGAGGEVSGNYATFNPLSDGLGCTVAEGNLQLSGSATSSARINGTIGVSSGKWYFEVTYTADDSYTLAGVGQDNITNQYPGQDAKSYAFDFFQGKKYNNGSQTTYGSTLSAGDVFMCALDLDNNKIFFGKNGTFFDSSNPASGANPAYTVTAGTYHIVGRLNPSGFASGNAIIDLNAGQRAYAYSAPTGFKSWNTANLPTPTIADGSAYFQTGLYTGTGSSSALAVSGPSNPDFVWIKRRSGATSHALYDVLRGFDERLYANSNTTTYTYGSDILVPTSTGFNLTTTDGDHNTSGGTYVAWQWDAGSSTVSNTDGNITANVRANQTAGFSIVTYSGSGSTSGTVGHGLNAAPGMVIVKARNATKDWKVAHSSLSAQYMLSLDQTYASNIASWDGVDSSVFKPARSGDTYLNTSGHNYVAYCMSPVAGFSAVGSYTGNGSSADGPFVYTGFRPALIILKPSSRTGNWTLFDTTRDTDNPANSRLHANLADAEATSNTIDILSNGFKIYRAGLTENSNNETYIWMAWAENPFSANGGLAR